MKTKTKIPELKTRTIALKELFGSDLKKQPKIYFPASNTFSLLSRVLGGPGTFTRKKRYPLHNKFLKARKEEIKVFAYVGSSINQGAPTTIDARRALGKNSKIYATDITPAKESIKKKIANSNLSIIKYDATRQPFPETCDAIRFANVSNWLNESQRRRAIINIWKSLRVGGYLLGSIEYFNREKAIEGQFVLRKTPHGFEEIIFEEKT